MSGRAKQDPVSESLEDTANLLAKIDMPDYEAALVTKGEEFSMFVAGATIDDVMNVLDVSVNISDPEMREVLVRGGKHIGLVDLDRDTRNSVFKVIHQGRVEGHNPLTIARRFREQIPSGRFSDPGIRAKVIARTETKFAQNISSIKAYEGSKVVTGLRIFDAQLGDTDAECQERNNDVIDFKHGQAMADAEHPNGTLNFAPEVDENARRQQKLTEPNQPGYRPPTHDCLNV